MEKIDIYTVYALWERNSNNVKDLGIASSSIGKHIELIKQNSQRFYPLSNKEVWITRCVSDRKLGVSVLFTTSCYTKALAALKQSKKQYKNLLDHNKRNDLKSNLNVYLKVYRSYPKQTSHKEKAICFFYWVLTKNRVIDIGDIPLEMLASLQLMNIRTLLTPIILLMLTNGNNRYKTALTLSLKDTDVRYVGKSHNLLK